MRKKIFLILAIGCMALSLAGCGNNSSGSSGNDTTQSIPSTYYKISVNVTHKGMIAYAREGQKPIFNENRPAETAEFSAEDGATYILEARKSPEYEYQFVKWTKDGADYSTDAKITITVSGKADYVAVFE